MVKKRVCIKYLVFNQTPWAEDGIRTRDPDLGKVVLYQLSYFRIFNIFNAFFKSDCKYTCLIIKNYKIFSKN